MKLRCVYFTDMVPIPGTSRRESIFHVDDGWSIERFDDGRVSLAKAENGNEPARAFVADGYAYTYEELGSASVPTHSGNDAASTELADLGPMSAAPRLASRRKRNPTPPEAA